jgi:hypothetical protein
MIRIYSSLKRVDKIDFFFKNQVLVHDYLYLFWARYLSKIEMELESSKSKIEEQLKSSTKSKKELKKTIGWIHDRQKRGVLIQLGEDGPLSIVYKTLIYEWRSSTIPSSYELQLDDLLEKLQEMEKQCVLSLPIRTSLLLPKTDGNHD